MSIKKISNYVALLTLATATIMLAQLAHADTTRKCPEGFTDAGATCTKPKSYGRGTGFLSQKACEAVKSSCEVSGALYYPKCKEGFHAVGCCVCSPDCPKDMKDIGVACEK